MQIHVTKISLFLIVLYFHPLSIAQPDEQARTLVVQGQTGQVPVVRVNGRPFVDLQSLAEVTNGSLNFKANRIILTFPAAAGSTPIPSEPAAPRNESGLSREFTKEGIETIAL